jgi:hypothetical protein
MSKRWKYRPEGSSWGEFGEDDPHGRMVWGRSGISPSSRTRSGANGARFALTAPALRAPGAAGPPVTPVATVGQEHDRTNRGKGTAWTER